MPTESAAIIRSPARKINRKIPIRPVRNVLLRAIRAPLMVFNRPGESAKQPRLHRVYRSEVRGVFAILWRLI